MKCRILLLLINLWLIPQFCRPQDTLFKGDEKLIVKVIEINPTTIKFKKENNLEGPIYEENKSNFKKVIFQNNIIETFEINNQISSSQNNYSTESKRKQDYDLGIKDAKSNYKNLKKGVSTGTWALFCGPFYGAIPAAIIATKEPDQTAIDIKTRNKNFEYKLGYQEGVRKVNKKTAWYGYGIGSASNIIILGTIYFFILANII